MNGVSSFEDFLTDLLGCFSTDPQTVVYIKESLSEILSNLKTLTTQGVDRYVTKYLIPELSRLIKCTCGVSAERQMMSLKPFIVIGLETFLQEGRVLNKDEIIQQAKKSIPQLIVETAIPNKSLNTNKKVEKVVAIVTKMFFDHGLSPTQSYEEFVKKDLKDVLCQAVMPELKEQLIRGLDIFLDYVENEPGIKDNPTHFMNLLVKVLTPYFPPEFLQCLESTFESTVKTLKRSSRKILKQTVSKTADRVASKIQEASSCISSLHHFEDFLEELLRCFFKDLVDEIKNELTAILSSLKTLTTQEVDRYVTNYLIPQLSRLIQSTCGVSVEKQLMSLKTFIIKGLETFLQKGRVPNKDEIIQLAKKSFPDLIIETTIPNASENTKRIVRHALHSVKEAVFNPGSETTPSVEKLLQVFLEKCKEVCIDRETLNQAIDKLIEWMPETVDNIMEFLVKHVLPALSVCFEAAAFALVTVFLTKCFEKLRKEGTVKQLKGRDLAKPLATKALNLASEKMLKNTAEVSTVVTETVVKRKVTHKIVQKCVIDKAGGKMAVETTKKVAAKTSKKVFEKVTQNAGSKAASTASQVTAKQSVKVGTKAVQGQGVQVASKTVQKASTKVSKNIGEGITNGVTEVTKKTAVKKTVKSTITETAESVTTTTTTKVTKTSVSKATHVSQTSTKAAAEAGMKNAAKAGVTAAGISAVVGGVFLYRDLKELDEKKEKGNITEKEYKEQKVERIGEYAGDVIGSGVVGVAVSVAALTGPAGLAAIGVGALFSYATGKLGGRIAKALA